MNVAVVYYSLTGTSAKLAQAIAAELDVEPLPIEDADRRKALGGAVRSVWQTLTGAPSEVVLPAIDVDELDLLIVGGPMWVGRPCAPLQTYLRTLQDEHTPVAFFMTSGASKPKRAFARMAKLCGQQPVATLWQSEDEINEGIDSWQLHNFIAVANRNLSVSAAA